MNEQVMGHFFRYKRTHADRIKFKVPTIKRRTPGLTRDEVATLAHVSTDWYTRIEQGRTGVNASPEVLQSLCQALALNAAEQTYVFNLANQIPPIKVPDPGNLELAQLLDQQLPAPAFIMDQTLTVLQANTTYKQLYGDFLSQPPLQRNLVWRVFHSAILKDRLTDWPTYAAYMTALFRQQYSRDADSPARFQVFEAIEQDATFQQTWQQLTVANFQAQPLLLSLPHQEELYLLEHTLQVPGQDLYVVIQLPGDEASLALLQNLASTPN
ncbi:XRE family transcriptional regulator [Agrilactobacillus composti DSM 18527 = JCM 14202]|uniref:XRE family transcriptional regulator n=2 Tax=Agrilactobacillus TaxID=2767875 RepID=A0A0R1Y3H9_9LACO|nr:helix-turn-helix transcriptional regulator [Agrilactobacillus composti]KRM34859.1 XRE family transcriptional regulator [Agrilactobacillus composti DSM 18527 = JCM 14202]